MHSPSDLSRRGVLLGTGALGALAAAGPASAAPNPAPKAKAAPAPRLPARGNFVIRNAYVMTMEPTPATSPTATCMCANGAIVAVGPDLNAPGAASDRRARHDRVAGPGRNALAHVEYAAAQHVGREGGPRLFPHHRGARAEIPAGRHVPGHAPRRRGSDQLRHHVRARLVPQHPRRRLCRRRPARAARSPVCARASPMARAGHAEQATASTSPTSQRCTTTGRSIPTTA